MKEKFENFIEKHWRAVVIGVALIYIGTGLFQIVTEIELDQTKTRSVESVLMVTAIAAFFYGKRKEKERLENEKQKLEEDNEVIIVEDTRDEDSN
ncbi:hypothetical protein [Vallitalea maricola]|uniref:Uncharacterized protein n=1 Tax=Vallitalea maricola TaxID=3074433 RepID=A0ACB5UM02_9FIRM|nr:hypothetical protein AN2V17_32230 [Vallitalea sp. AN17-2]